MKTLIEFINDNQSDFPYATGEFTRLLNDIGIAAKIVNREVNKAGLTNILGAQGQTNVQGESQQKLDVFANDHFINALRSGGQVCAIASEENDELILLDNPTSRNGKYVVAIDPLDGSSNIDVNIPIGTIFTIYRRKSKIGETGKLEDLLQAGAQVAAAGYIIYGSSTIMVYSTGKGVNGFTYDGSVGLFLLSHSKMRVPTYGSIYSINEANYIHFPEGVKQYIKYCQIDDEASCRPYTSRYIGSLVGDVHRNLIKGGIFLYPGNAKKPTGKLRLLYECIPMAFIVEQAGGKASDGFNRILDIVPETIHQRSPLFIGSTEMVERAENLMKEHSAEVEEIMRPKLIEDIV
ncbi:MAG: class 1 fructose-bisphosphatase [Bacteroidales bacterium]|nr:class 1 fructose-bisphosphatase [Bacteroidales bacterium]